MLFKDFFFFFVFIFSVCLWPQAELQSCFMSWELLIEAIETIFFIIKISSYHARRCDDNGILNCDGMKAAAAALNLRARSFKVNKVWPIEIVSWLKIISCARASCEWPKIVAAAAVLMSCCFQKLAVNSADFFHLFSLLTINLWDFNKIDFSILPTAVSFHFECKIANSLDLLFFCLQILSVLFYA